MVAIHWAQLKTAGNGKEMRLLMRLFRYIKEMIKRSSRTHLVINWLQNWCNEGRKLSMWHLGTWMGSGGGSVRLTVALYDLRCLVQSKSFYDSIKIIPICRRLINQCQDPNPLRLYYCAQHLNEYETGNKIFTLIKVFIASQRAHMHWGFLFFGSFFVWDFF